MNHLLNGMRIQEPIPVTCTPTSAASASSPTAASRCVATPPTARSDSTLANVDSCGSH